MKNCQTFFIVAVATLFMVANNIFAQTFSGGTGTEADPYLISSKADLDVLADSVNTIPYWSSIKHFKVTNDITEPFQNRIGFFDYEVNNFIERTQYAFCGHFDGGGYRIMLDINMPDKNNVGLFGLTFIGGHAIKNVIVEGSVIGKEFVGGLIAEAHVGDSWKHLISCCYSYCDVTAVGTDGYSIAGGLIGSGSAIIVNCYATGNVSGVGDYVGGLIGWHGSKTGPIINSYATGNVSGNNFVGGLAGYTDIAIFNSYFTGNVNSAGDSVGAIAGYIRSDSNLIKNCYYINTNTKGNQYGTLISADELKSVDFSQVLNEGDVSGEWLGWLFGSDYDVVLAGPWEYDANNINQGYPITTCGFYTHITDHTFASHFTISPNPASADVVTNFSLLESGEITLEVCDIFGNVLISVTNFYDAGEHFVPLDLDGLASGSYICRLISKGKQIGIANFVIWK